MWHYKREIQLEVVNKVQKRSDGALLVPLTNSDQFAVVDAEWEEDVLCQDWCLNSNGYVRMSSKSQPRFYLHQFILGAKLGFIVDHINGDKLDNRQANLRHVTWPQQLANTALRSDNRLGHKGIYFHRQNKNWVARISFQRQCHSIGSFPTLEEAVVARKQAEREVHGEYARKESR